MAAILEGVKGFIWDEWNKGKSARKHGVSPAETEEAFFNDNLVSYDKKHSRRESRWRMLGQSKRGKVLFTVFTIRNNMIRVISSRPANKRERGIYEKKFKKVA
ncbi:MAG: BrnT family toxin [Candidatus Kerfeldbacteria bacterium]|nr:BrnT family toxin [Candidatus Kerfeldbacteria bacterium]